MQTSDNEYTTAVLFLEDVINGWIPHIPPQSDRCITAIQHALEVLVSNEHFDGENRQLFTHDKRFKQ
jgi:hypothetical protein